MSCPVLTLNRHTIEPSKTSIKCKFQISRAARCHAQPLR